MTTARNSPTQDIARLATSKPERRYDIDWLRVLAMATVFVFHNVRFFDSMDWHVKDTHRTFAADVIIYFVFLWIMPLFFLLAGAGSRFALESHSGRHFVWQRFKRLIIPFIFGVFVLTPPQVYMEWLTHSSFHESFVQFYPQFFTHRLRSFHWNFGWLFGQWGYHLWFLGFLFVFSVLGLPLFSLLRRAASQSLISRLAGLCDRQGGIFLLAAPLAIIQMALRAAFDDYLLWADFFYWLLIFFYGYLIYSHERFMQAAASQRVAALVVGILSFASLLATYYAGYLETWLRHPSYTPGYMLFQILWTLDTWAWLVFILGMGIRFLNFRSEKLSYANEAVLPFYVLHQPIILGVGFFVVRWQVSIPVKYVIIATSSFVIIMALYELLIRRTSALRFLFGMAPKKSTSSRGLLVGEAISR